MEYTFSTYMLAEAYGTPVWAEITYKAIPAQADEHYFTRFGHEIELVHTEYKDGPRGAIVHAEGSFWIELEREAQELAEAHFSGDLEAA